MLVEEAHNARLFLWALGAALTQACNKRWVCEVTRSVPEISQSG